MIWFSHPSPLFYTIFFQTADSVELALQLNGITVLDRNIRISRVLSDPKNNRNLKVRKVVKNKKYQPNAESIKKLAKHKEDGTKSGTKSKSKPDFQGQKTKPNIRKKKVRTQKHNYIYILLVLCSFNVILGFYTHVMQTYAFRCS